MKKMLFLVLFALAVSGCGNAIEEHKNPAPDVTPADNDQSTTPQTIEVATVINSDYASASVSLVELDNENKITSAINIANAGDAVAKFSGEYLYVISRYNGNAIQVLDPKNSFDEIANYSVGTASNPQDIVVVGEKAYVSRLEAQRDTTDQNDVIIIRPLTGEKIGGFDLKSYMTDDGEKLARATKMVLVGKYIYVLCQDLSGFFEATTNGKIVVINTETDEIVTSINLDGRNPSEIEYSSDLNKIFVTDTGTYETTDYITFFVDLAKPYEGIEVVDVATNTTDGIKIKGEDLGGSVSELKIVGKNLGYVISNLITLASFNPETFEIINKSIYTSLGFIIPDINTTLDGTVLLADNDFTNAGVLLIKDDKVIAGPLKTGAAPPVSIAVVTITE